MVSQLDFYSWKLRDGRLLQADKCYCWGKKQLWLENARPQDIESWPGLAASCLSIVWWLGLLYTSRAPNGGNFLNIFSSDDHRVGTINLIPSRLIINTWFEAWKVFMPFGFRNNYTIDKNIVCIHFQEAIYSDATSGLIKEPVYL